MGKVPNFLKSIFYASIFILIIISLFPGSLLGYFLYGDLTIQPKVIDIEKSYGISIINSILHFYYLLAEVSIHHFLYFFFLSLLGLSLYMKKNFYKTFYVLLFLSFFLEILNFIVPNRAFEIYDLVANLMGVIVAYLFLIIYKLPKRQ